MDSYSLAERLVADGNDFRMLANCYWFCAKPDNFATLARTFTVNPKLATLQSTLRAQFRKILESRGISVLPAMLAANTPEESLIQVSSLLRALSGYVVTVEGHVKVPTFDPVYVTPTFEAGCPELCIAPRPSTRVNPLRTPSQESDQALTMDEFHRELHIHPRKIGHCSLEWKRLPRRTDEWLEEHINKGRLKIAVSGLLNEVELDAGPVPGFPPDQQVRFRVPGVKDETRQIEHLMQVLNACKERRVSILVLPEIRVTGALLDATRDFLRAQSDNDREAGNALLVVVAGSRHVETDTGWVNRATVLDTDGDVIWEHDKLLSYRIHDPETIERLRPTLGLNEHGGIEAIIPGRSLTYCDCSLGRFSVAICVGFFHADVEPVLKGSGATWFFVPAMTPRIRQLEERAGTLVNSQRAATFVANCAKVGGEKALSFFRLPFRRSEAVHIVEEGMAGVLLTCTFNKQLTLDLIFAGKKTIN